MQQINRDSVDYRSAPTLYYGQPWGAYEEYWYDALGRRILKRSIQSSPVCTYSVRCYSSIERYVWDGDQILWEVRQANAGDTKNPIGSTTTGQTGNIGYVHAGSIDAPVGILRNGAAIVLHRNWRGLYAFATDTNGAPTTCAPDWFSGCQQVSWPGVNWTLESGYHDATKTETWYGTLPMGQQDRTGLMYRRNRYYDSGTGQFTQQDPIGIAGGLNLYGYANGDPVNFHDPFGLECDTKTQSGTGAKTVDCKDENSESDQVWFLGLGGGATIGSGGNLAAGFMYSEADGLGGLGVYARGGVGSGLELSLFVEGGMSPSRQAFDGKALDGCVGVLGAGACVSGNDTGITYSANGGVGSKSLPVPVSVYAGVSSTGSVTFGDVLRTITSYVAQADAMIRSHMLRRAYGR